MIRKIALFAAFLMLGCSAFAQTTLSPPVPYGTAGVNPIVGASGTNYSTLQTCQGALVKAGDVAGLQTAGWIPYVPGQCPTQSAPSSSGPGVKNSAGTAGVGGDTLKGNAATSGTWGSGSGVLGFAQLDGSGNFTGNWITQTGTLSSLQALVGTAGGMAYATDTPALVMFNGSTAAGAGGTILPLAVPVPLNKGGTGDGSNFSWTGSSKTLVARNINADGTNNLNIATPNGTASAGTINISSGNVTTGSSSGIGLTSGGATTGTAGPIALNGGTATNGTAGGVTALAGSDLGNGVGGPMVFTAGNTATGGSANAGYVGFVAGVDQATQVTNTLATGGSPGIYFGDAAGNYYIFAQTATASKPALAFFDVSLTPAPQATTSGASATVAGAAACTTNCFISTTTFDGYTIAQIVKALRNYGLLH